MDQKINRNDQDKYRMIWLRAELTKLFGKFDTEKAWNKVDSKLKVQGIRVRRLWNLGYVISGVVATILIFISLTIFTGLFSISGSAIILSTTYGSRSEVVLPDGSVVKLNAGSNLHYHYDKLSNTRRVDFKGEGFFEVAKSKHPFIIHTPDGLNVKVLGTSFNLSAYPEDPLAQTSLVEGSVELSINGYEGMVLNPGQIASFDKQSKKLVYTLGEVSHQLGWIQDKLYMDNMPLHEICLRLERRYDVNITLNPQIRARKIHYTGILKEQSVVDVLDAMSQLSSIKYKMEGKNITIYVK